MAAKKVKPATDSIIGRRVRINDDATYPNGNRHAWAGFTGTVRVHNGRSVYQVEMDDAEAIEVFPLDSFTLLVDAYLADAAAVDTSAPATPGTPEPTAPDHGELALHAIAQRSQANGAWKQSPLWWHEIDSIHTALDLHKFQMQHLSAREYHGAIRAAAVEVFAQGGTVYHPERLAA